MSGADRRERGRSGTGERGSEFEQVMLLDVGNTSLVFGVLREGELEHHVRLSTDRERTADEYGAMLLLLLDRLGLDARATTAFFVASVVPPLGPVIRALARDYFGVEAVFVEPGIKTGLPIRVYENPAELGADRIVNALAAREHYGAPVVVVDLGTATTFDVVDGSGAYVGGIIAPGIAISAEALFAQASKLYRVDLEKPARLVGRTTASAMQSGIYHGYASLIDGILERLADEFPDLATVVCTGSHAELIAEACQRVTHVDDMLTLEGLRLVYERNRPRGRQEGPHAASRQAAAGKPAGRGRPS